MDGGTLNFMVSEHIRKRDTKIIQKLINKNKYPLPKLNPCKSHTSSSSDRNTESSGGKSSRGKSKFSVCFRILTKLGC